MRASFRVVSLAILPLLVMLVLGLQGDGHDSRFPLFLFVNAALVAVPQLIWFALFSLCRFPARVSDAGLLAADVVLITFGIAMFLSPLEAMESGWLLYFPVVIAAILLSAAAGKLTRKRI